MSLNAIKMLSFDEGVRYRVYKDTAGKLTVGIGFNMDSPNARAIWLKAGVSESFNLVYGGKQSLSVNSVQLLFNACMDSAITDLKSIFPDYDTYPELVQLALINMVFNMGKPVFETFFSTIKLIKARKWDEVAEHILGTLWSKQVGQRSVRVANLFKGVDSLFG